MRAATIGIVLCLAGALPASAPAAGPPLAPYKDDLFQNHVIRTLYDGDFRFVEYSRDRDLHARDEIVEKKANARFVSLEPTEVQSDLVLEADGQTVRYVGVGKTGGGARFIVIFVHGDRGNRFQAVDDWSFGGNFNRLKNLVTRNGGVYLSTDFSNFRKKGVDELKALMGASVAASPGAPIILACTSRGGELCFHLIEDPQAAALISGLVLLGAGNEETFFASPVFTDPARAIPIFIGHGSGDVLIPWVTQELFFKEVKAARPDYPIRFDLFVDGAHGTPMRLTDWRHVLNWMIPQARTPAVKTPPVPAASIPLPSPSPRR